MHTSVSKGRVSKVHKCADPVHTNSVSHYNILLLLLHIKNYNSSQIRIRPENNTRRFSDEIHTQNSFDKSVTTLWHGVVLLKPNRFEIKAQPKF